MSNSFRSDEPRYERKFLLNPYQTLSIHHLIKLHPAGFSQAYAPREVNNIYYDTSDFSHFRENIAGVSPRKKVRIRWYGAFDTITHPTLEIKAKIGEVVTKSSLGLSTYNPKTVAELLLRNGTKYQPVLKNSYRREYYISADREIRLTLDSHVNFDTVHDTPLLPPTHSFSFSIIELKYSLDSEFRASQIAAQLPFRLSKSSKYEQGISLCYPHLTIL